MIISNNKKKNYLEYLNENYFKEKGFVKIKSKLDKVKVKDTFQHKTRWQKLTSNLYKKWL